LDIPFLDNVINYDYPDNTKLFIHRIGRTARAGKGGRVFSILSSQDFAYFTDMKVSLERRLILNYYDSQKFKNDDNLIQKALEDPAYISFGSIPSKVLNRIREERQDYLNHKTDLEALEQSSTNAYKKRLTFKQKPSKFGIKQAKKLSSSINSENNILIHPFYLNKLENEDENEKI